MTEPSLSPELSALLETARSAVPDALPPLTQRRLVRAALAAAEQRRADARPRLWWAVAAAALLLCVIGATLLSATPHTRVEVAAGGLPLRLALKTGDVLTLAPDSELLVLAESAELRKVQLTRGTALFDVAKLGSGHGFEVHTANGTVRVLGTVFSVQADSRRTQVRVHEGKVLIAGVALQAGDSWSSTGLVAGPAPMSSEASAAVAARLAPPAPRVITPLPSVTPGVPRSAIRAPLAPRLPASTPSADETDLLRAHQLRAQGQFEAAIEAYEALALQSASSAGVQAGFAAAQLIKQTLGDDARALADVERFQLTAPGSPLRERARALRIELLWELGRDALARDALRTYLAEEPATETSQRLRKLLDTAR